MTSVPVSDSEASVASLAVSHSKGDMASVLVSSSEGYVGPESVCPMKEVWPEFVKVWQHVSPMKVCPMKEVWLLNLCVQ